MIPVLEKLFKKRGITKVEELSQEEQQTFKEWQLVLNKEELNIEDIKNFCRNQLEVIEGKWADLNLDQSKKAELIPYHTVYKLLLMAIEAPKSAKEALEKNLIQLLQ